MIEGPNSQGKYRVDRQVQGHRLKSPWLWTNRREAVQAEREATAIWLREGRDIFRAPKRAEASHKAQEKGTKVKPTPTIIVDTREQTPLEFTMPSEWGTLQTGDYSVRGLENHVAIERKSADDLVGSLVGEHRQRFERELARGRALDYFALVVETDLAAIRRGEYRSKMLPQAVVQSIVAMSVRHRLPVFFCPGRIAAAEVVESLLAKYVREIEKKVRAVA